MITLCGFSLSNYYNKVKLVLLEKGLPFVEEHCPTGCEDEATLSCSPLGKLPFIRTAHGPLCESQAIVEYLEALQPEPRLLPADPWACAKVRELTIFTELHLELVARQLYGAAFFGGTTDYLRENLGGVVETEDFRRALEARTGRSLVRFFEQWLYTAGYPDLKVSFAYDAERGEGSFRIEQAQVGPKGTGPLFELDTAVGWVLDGEAHSWPVRLDQAVQSVTVKLPRDPDQVRFDPQHQVLAKLAFDPGETITRKEVVMNVQAALSQLGYDSGIPDGVAGPKTSEAIKSVERATGMSESGAINPRLLAVLGSQPV